VTVLVALLFMAAVALRGYVPGADQVAADTDQESPLAGIVVVGLLAAAVAVVVVAVVLRLMGRNARPPTAAARSDWLRRDRAGPTWRVSVIAFGLILGWLLLYAALSRLGGPRHDVPAQIPGTTPDEAESEAARNAADLPPDVGGESSLLGYFYTATVIFLFVLVVGTIIASRRRRRPAHPARWADDGESGEPNTRSESLARAAEVGLAEVGDLSREPRKAIIACYAAMERELSLLPDAAPRDFDTASEVLARAVDHHALRPDSATQLVDLFDEARFSSHVMNEGHRDAAIGVLTHVLDELRSHA